MANNSNKLIRAVATFEEDMKWRKTVETHGGIAAPAMGYEITSVNAALFDVVTISAYMKDRMLRENDELRNKDMAVFKVLSCRTKKYKLL